MSLAGGLLEKLLPEVDCAEDCLDDELERGFGSIYNAVGGPGRHSLNRLCHRRVANRWYKQGFRLLDRRGLFGQSKGVWAVQNVISRSGSEAVEADVARAELKRLCAEDIYHLFLDAKLVVQLLVVVLVSLLSFCIFALFFLLVEEPCGLNIEYSFLRAYMLSVETMTTIGYGVADPYMRGCWQGPILLTATTLTQMLISAVVIGVVYQGICRPQSRASTVVFSEKAVINCEDGTHFLRFRVADLRIQHALIDPHVRCYCLHSSRDGVHITTAAMSVEASAHVSADSSALMPLLPNVISHRIDSSSPLNPPRLVEPRSGRSSLHSSDTAPRLSTSSNLSATMSTAASTYNSSTTTLLRNLSTTTLPPQSSTTGCGHGSGACSHLDASQARELDGLSCPTCGQEFASVDRLRRHCQYLAYSDAVAGVPEEYRHKELTDEELELLSPLADFSRDDITAHLSQGYFEVVVLVEGTEPTTGASIQKRHSYVVSGPAGGSDVVWDAEMEECCRIRADGSAGVVVDLGRFNRTRPVSA